MKPTPSRFITAQTKNPLHPQSTGTRLLTGDQPRSPKPHSQGKWVPRRLCPQSLWTDAGNLGMSSDDADPTNPPFPDRPDRQSRWASAIESNIDGKRLQFQTAVPFPACSSDNPHPCDHTTSWVRSSQVDSPITRIDSVCGRPCCCTAKFLWLQKADRCKIRHGWPQKNFRATRRAEASRRRKKCGNASTPCAAASSESPGDKPFAEWMAELNREEKELEEKRYQAARRSGQKTRRLGTAFCPISLSNIVAIVQQTRRLQNWYNSPLCRQQEPCQPMT